MKRHAMFALSACFCAWPALAEPQPLYDPGSGNHPIEQASRETAAGPGGEAGRQDLNAALEPTAAGRRPVRHLYLDGGHYGGSAGEECS